jgi:hypothetical protein
MAEEPPDAGDSRLPRSTRRTLARLPLDICDNPTQVAAERLDGPATPSPQAAVRHRTEGGRAGRRNIDAFGTIDSPPIATITKAGPPGTERDGTPPCASQGKSTS